MALQIYDFVSFFFTILLDIFFREIRPRGSHKIPQKGPVIFVAAPHANQVSSRCSSVVWQMSFKSQNEAIDSFFFLL
jgi:hypothetical protein